MSADQRMPNHADLWDAYVAGVMDGQKNRQAWLTPLRIYLPYGYAFYAIPGKSILCRRCGLGYGGPLHKLVVWYNGAVEAGSHGLKV